MVEILGSFFSMIFGNNVRVATTIISMFPIIELKGAIPVGVSQEFWGDNALSELQSFGYSLFGSCVVVPIIALVFIPIINYMKSTKTFKKIALVIEGKVSKSRDKIQIISKDGGVSKKNTILKMLGVFLFVSFPIPLTGVWTGTCIAVSLGLKFWQIVISCILGNVVAGIFVMFVCSAFPQFTSIIFLIVLAIVIVLFMLLLVKIFRRKKTET